MARNFNIRRQLSETASNIGDMLDQMNFALSNDNLLSRQLMDELKQNIQTVDILYEISRAQETVHIMNSTINLLKLEEKRRRVQAVVQLFYIVRFYILCRRFQTSSAFFRSCRGVITLYRLYGCRLFYICRKP